jgi:D-amino-acid dehydrogenase
VTETCDVVVIGGGILGAAIGYHLSRAGLDPVLVDRRDQGHATWAGAGIVCPVTATVGNDQLVDLAFAAAASYPVLAAGLAEELAAADESATGYVPSAMLSVSVGGTGRDYVSRIAGWASQVARESRWAAMCGCRRLGQAASREYCPVLADDVSSGLLIPSAARVDGDRFRQAMLAAGQRRGLRVLRGDARLVINGQGAGEVTIDGTTFAAGHVVICAGAWTERILRLGEDTPVVIPTRGEILHLQVDGLDTTSWPLVEVEGSGPYIIAWPEGRLAVGTTVERALDFDARPTMAGIQAIAESLGRATGDQIKRAKFIECRVGLRPMSADGLPIIGPWRGNQRVLVATGHGANGLSWGPYTGKLVTDIITGQPAEIDLRPFAADRFVRVSEKEHM